ncbi:MAG TPA: sulfatase-like hydrolase/transferase, partial [Candidatus Kapabacteria bacterium]|nr:sulfatase-like hydrolase/transferase [Candidatus Kapabacteria bacterium]
LSSKYNFSQGFDSFSDTWDKNIKYNEPWFRIGESVNKSLFEQVDEYLEKRKKNEKENDKPLFIWVHYYDPHTPYVNRKEITFKDYEKNKKQFRFINYDKEIRYTDEQIKKLFGYLEKKGLTETMVTCITADHGEQLGDHGASAVHHDFYSETAFVPLLFHGYRIPKNKVVEEYVSTMDIAATIFGRLKLDEQKPWPVQGVNLLDPKGNPKPVPQREFLVIGDPTFVRSIQWLSAPFSYIMNFDYMYKQWFVARVARRPVVPGAGTGTAPDFEDRLIKVPTGVWHEEFLDKSDKYVIEIKYPDKLRTGLYFGVLRFDVEKDNGFSVGYRIGPGNTKTTYSFADKKTGAVTITAFFSVTPLDHVTGIIQRKKETRIANLKFALLPEAEALKYITDIPARVEVENRIFAGLKTQRKLKTGDELYNLETDVAMVKNIFPGSGSDSSSHIPLLKERVVKGKKAIYDFIRFYGEESKKILGKSTDEKALTEEEKDMFKSLGYL